MHESIRSFVKLVAAAIMLAACAGSATAQLGADGSGGTSAASSVGGRGGAASRSSRRPMSDLVAAGNRSTSGARTVVSSLGESPGTNGVSRSLKYQLVGGLLAATQP